MQNSPFLLVKPQAQGNYSHGGQWNCYHEDHI